MAEGGPGAYPPVSFHFKVQFSDLPGDADARFQEVAGLSRELGTEEVVEGGQNAFTHKLPARARSGNLVLKRGLPLSSELRDWCERAIGQLEITPKDVSVHLLNEEHDP